MPIDRDAETAKRKIVPTAEHCIRAAEALVETEKRLVAEGIPIRALDNSHVQALLAEFRTGYSTEDELVEFMRMATAWEPQTARLFCRIVRRAIEGDA